MTACSSLGETHVSWVYEHGVIRVYRGFEKLMLEVLVGVMNNDTATVGSKIGVPLPKHLTDEVCQYLVVGTGYFDFKGRDGLLALLQRFLPGPHWLVKTIRKPTYKDTLEQLSALRNFAAHSSARAKKTAKEVTGHERLASAGAWLKHQGRFSAMTKHMRLLAQDITKSAPR